MTPFLAHTAQHLWELHGMQLSTMRMVFPNKRSALYFTKYLKKYTENYFIVPECMTINELFLSQSKKVIPDRLTLTGKLYKSFKSITQTSESFSEFYPFANLLLGDFDTIDKHLVDTQQLFQNIVSLQAIDNTLSYLTEEQLAAIQQFWKSFDVAKHSEQQQFFLQMWEALPKVYVAFNEALEKEGLAYEGRVFREVVEALQKGGTTLAKTSHVFIGFNALSKAERETFHLLQQQHRTFFYWDYDNYFIENKHNEAGRFIGKHLKDFPNPTTFLQEDKIDVAKEVVHLECATEVQQAKILGEMLVELPKEELAATAVVLANEELLPVVLSSLPEELDAINISMGFPLKETPWMQFLELIVQLHKTTRWEADMAYFASDIVQKLLMHPYATHIEKKGVAVLQEQIQKHNKVWIAAGSVKGKLRRVLAPIRTERDSYAYLKPLLTFLFAKSRAHSADRELMLRTGIFAQRIHKTLQTLEAHVPQFFWTLLLQELGQQRMPFQTNSEESLQVIGFLETRLLDFEKVYILSANENYLPNIQLAGSLIPYNLRIGAGLPTLDEQNSMYAYYFYRLLSRCRKMTLFSVVGTEDMQCKEQSRYITQLQYEAPFSVKEMTVSASLDWVQPRSQLIAKDEICYTVFEQYFSGIRAISPSALNTYLRCPQQFYYKYIKGLKEVESISKADDNNMFGSIFHKAAELLYIPYVGEEITVALLQQLEKEQNIEQLILQAFRKELFGNDEDRALRGKEWLIFDALKHFMQQLLERDKKYAPFSILGLEEKMQASIPVTIDGKSQQLILKGSIDRIDEKKGVIRVVDYKTGYINRGFLSLEELFLPCGKYRNPTALQTFFYSWLFYQNTGDLPSPCVYHLRELDKELEAEFKIGEGRRKVPFDFVDHFAQYENLLQKLLVEIFDNLTPFYPTKEAKECSHDAHSGMCTLFGG